MQTLAFNHFDYGIIILIVLSGLVGLKRGFLTELIALIIWCVAIVVAMAFDHQLNPKVLDYIRDEKLSLFISFLLLFWATLVVGGILNYIISHFAVRQEITFSDRIIGSFFGILRGSLLILIILFIIASTRWKDSDFYKTSVFAIKGELPVKYLQDHLTDVTNTVRAAGEAALPPPIKEEMKNTMAKTDVLS